MAPPFLLRPVYLDYDGVSSTAQAFLGRNRITESGGVRDVKLWEKTFHEVMWLMFCVWVSTLEEARAKMEEHPKWKQWAKDVERTLHPGEGEIPPARKRLIPSRARYYLNVIRDFLVSIMFTLFQPSFVFSFILSFSTSPIMVPSTLTYP